MSFLGSLVVLELEITVSNLVALEASVVAVVGGTLGAMEAAVVLEVRTDTLSILVSSSSTTTAYYQ